MKLYHFLSQINFLKKSYTNKFLFVAFLGIHIPLIGLIITLVFNKKTFSVQTILLFTLIFTLLASFVTLYVINKLIVPINVASVSLTKYRRNRIVPNLPIRYKDEAGRLLYNVQRTINDNENYLVQKQDFITLLAHDLKNFASQPNSLAHLILDENDNDEIKKLAQHIINSSEGQLTFLNSFINILREEELISSIEPDSNDINFDEILIKIENQLRPMLNKKNILFKQEITTQNAHLMIDEMMLSRLIFNLLHNAVKFSHSQSEIKLNIDLNKEYLKIKVTDNGIGFTETQSKHLFNKFSQLSRKGTSSEESVGIGLYLCKQIVHKFNGTIDAFSDGENRGAIFTVRFKIAK